MLDSALKYDINVHALIPLQIHGAESEFNSLLKLEHPNLVHYKALSSTEKDDCLVVDLLVEHVPGINLSQSLVSHAAVPLDKLCHYAAQLLAALDYLHSNSVVHKQLGASSVLLDAEGNVRLTDYSLSKRLADICTDDIFEQAHVRFSEDTAMPTKTGKKGDVWNLGLMLLALSQGKEVKEYPVTVPASLPADFQDFLNRYGRMDRVMLLHLLTYVYILMFLSVSPFYSKSHMLFFQCYVVFHRIYMISL